MGYCRSENMSLRRYRDFSCKDDVGLVYTRDKYGHVRTPSGYGLTANVKSYLNDIEPRVANCSIEVLNGKTSPCSLYFISLDFVAKNITMVESLCGFPDIVGKDIFDQVNSNEGFTHQYTPTMQLFCDAYGNLVLSRLNLTGQCMAVNQIDYLKYFPFISELDLSHCRLGKSHELLVYVFKMPSLTRLNLKDNCLNDSDIKLFTLPLRVMKVGPCNMSLLDLSCNPGITDTSVRYLVTSFRLLTGLNLSGTSVTIKHGVAKLTRETNLILNSKFAGFGEENQITTDGWAASVIANWTTTIKTVKKEPSTTNTKVQSFYAMKTKAKTLQGTNSNNCKFKEMEQVPVIILHNALSLAKRSQGTAMVEISQENERKNGKGQDSETKHASYKHKRKKQSSGDDKKPLMDLDEDMMQSYLSSSGIVTYSDNKKRKLTLANL